LASTCIASNSSLDNAVLFGVSARCLLEDGVLLPDDCSNILAALRSVKHWLGRTSRRRASPSNASS